MSASIFAVGVGIFAAMWIGCAYPDMKRGLKVYGGYRWLVGLLGGMAVVGAAGFFAFILSALGFLKFSPSFQWPVGYVDGVARLPGGKYVVPLEFAGRVQLYDENWHFLRGWQVDTSEFRVGFTPKGTIEVISSRKGRHYSFAENGNLISVEPLSHLGPDVFLAPSSPVVVPTSPLLWIFSSPVYCWGLTAVGIIGLSIAEKIVSSKGGGGPATHL